VRLSIFTNKRIFLMPNNEITCAGSTTLFITLSISLYILKQSPCSWYQWFSSYITKVGFSCSKFNTSLFVLHGTLGTSFLLLYVDIILTASSMVLLKCVIMTIKSEFVMMDMGIAILPRYYCESYIFWDVPLPSEVCC
jgi:hypothetical protein